MESAPGVQKDAGGVLAERQLARQMPQGAKTLKI